MSAAVTVRVPASSANLGPGFDCMAAAVDLWLQVTVQESERFQIITNGGYLETKENLIVKSFESVASADQVSFTVNSDIPVTGGLGSSSAAIVAGLAAAHLLNQNFKTDDPSEAAMFKQQLLNESTAIEGHPDNVAAAIFGGFVLIASPESNTADGPSLTEPKSSVSETKTISVEEINVPSDLSAVVVVSEESVSTANARAALPTSLTYGQAVHNVAAAAGLALGLERQDLRMVARSLRDQLHQPQRSGLYPLAAGLLSRADELGALGATVSGAGPTILLWCARQQIQTVTERAVEACKGWGTAQPIEFSDSGFQVVR